jgi:hypothetical protein
MPAHALYANQPEQGHAPFPTMRLLSTAAPSTW